MLMSEGSEGKARMERGRKEMKGEAATEEWGAARMRNDGRNESGLKAAEGESERRAEGMQIEECSDTRRGDRDRDGHDGSR